MPTWNHAAIMEELQTPCWDVTCPNTFAPSHLPKATSELEAGAVAALAERSKHEKYSDLDQCHTFAPVTIVMSGPLGQKSLSPS